MRTFSQMYILLEQIMSDIRKIRRRHTLKKIVHAMFNFFYLFVVTPYVLRTINAAQFMSWGEYIVRKQWVILFWEVTELGIYIS